MSSEEGLLVADSSDNSGVLMAFDANRKSGLNALFSWLDAGIVVEEPERLAEGKFVVLLEPAVHYVVERIA
jgi:hypothetical protein